MVKVRVRRRRRRSQERDNLRRYHARRHDPLITLALYGISMLVVMGFGVAAFHGLDQLYNPEPPQPRHPAQAAPPSI